MLNMLPVFFALGRRRWCLSGEAMLLYAGSNAQENGGCSGNSANTLFCTRLAFDKPNRDLLSLLPQWNAP